MKRRRYLATTIVAAVVLAPLPACFARGEPEPGRVPEAYAGVTRLGDSLVLTAPGGTTVWFTEGRPAVSPTGENCIERSLQIRREAARLTVPLLYTVSAPVLLDDTTLRAELAEHCRPARAYRVNLRTARPTPMEARP
jgi:hypothetical protein